MRTVAVVALVVVGGLLADRALLAAEARGWVYYRRRKPSSGAISSAVFGPAFDVFQPSREILVEELRSQELRRDVADEGAPPRP